MPIIDAILPKLVSVGRASFEVRSPTVREAIVLLHAGPEALKGDLDSQKIVLNMLRDWYPKRFWKIIKKQPLKDLIESAIQITNDGFEKSKEKKNGKKPTEVKWDLSIAKFMNTFGYEFDAVLDMPWVSFIILSSQIRAVKALNILDAIHASSVPQISNEFARKSAIMQLKADAGLEVFETIKDDTALDNLNLLGAELSMFA